MLVAGPNCGAIVDLLFRINNTDLTGLTDGATIYIPAELFDAS